MARRPDSINPDRDSEAPLEIEERFLVHKIDTAFYRGGRPMEIRQGYLPEYQPNMSARIRIRTYTDAGNNRVVEAFLTVKTGRGRVRGEEEYPITDIGLAQRLLDLCPFRITKTRYVTDDEWEIDELHGPLEGIILAEKEVADPNEVVTLPAWIHEAVNVTDSVTNMHLAVLAHHLECVTDARPILDHLVPNVPMIVLTGGPGSGKTTLMQACVETFGDRMHCVPEVASILIAQLGVPPPSDPNSRDYLQFQRTLYTVQREFEALAQMQARRDGKKAVLLDRGTLDAMAYLPRPEQYEAFFNTSPDNERQRYAKAIVLAPPPENVYNRIRTNNPARSESYTEAVALSQRIASAWETARTFDDPSELTWRVSDNWDAKRAHVLDQIRTFLDAL